MLRVWVSPRLSKRRQSELLTRKGGSVQARTLIASEYMAKERAHFALSHEFCRIIQEADDAHVVAPGIDNYLSRRLGRILPPHDTHNVQRDFNRLVNGVRKGL